MPRKLVVSLLILSAGCASIFLLWRNPYYLSAVLLALAYVKHHFYPIKRELLWFCIVCVGGALTEILLVNAGGAWNYTLAQMFNIPIWMPLFWGMVATTLIVIYDSLTEWLEH